VLEDSAVKLTDLEPQFLAHERRPASEEHLRLNPPGKPGHRDYQDWFTPVDTFAEAHGIRFLCPKSFVAETADVGAHSIYIWFEGSPVPPEIGRNKDGQTMRWRATGTGLHDLTLQPSIQEQDDHCKWHGFVTNGDATA
jgi:hypothetical protein